MNLKSSKNKFCDIFRYFDIFGINFQFRIEGEEKFQSSTGGLWLIAFIILSIGLFTNTINNYIKNPDFSTLFLENRMDFQKTSDHIDLNYEHFYFGVYSQSEDPKIDTSKVFTSIGYYRERNINTNYILENKKLGPQKCDPNLFSSNLTGLSNGLSNILNNMICFNTTTKKIRGSYLDDDYSDISIETHFNPNTNLTYFTESLSK